MSPPLDSELTVALRAFLHQVGESERLIRASRRQARPDQRPPTAAELRQRLKDSLAEQDTLAQRRGRDPGSDAFRQARHLMATLADVTFQGLEWWGRAAWFEKPLVVDYPLPDGIREGVPAQIEQLLGNQPPNPELTQVYLLALATGAFPELAGMGYRQRLFRALGTCHPEITQPADRLFPEAYRRHQRRGPAGELPLVRRWAVAVVVLGALLLTLSAPLWLQATAVARQTVDQILAAGR